MGISVRRFSCCTLPMERPSRTLGASRARRRMPARQSRGADRDVAGVDGQTARLVQHCDGLEHVVEVGHRLAHALEDHAVHAAAAQAAPDRAHLLDDLPGLEVAREPHAAGRAELAAQRAAHLRADADREARPVLERDAHRLEHVAVVRAQGVLHERVDLALLLCQQLERGHLRPRHGCGPGSRGARRSGARGRAPRAAPARGPCAPRAARWPRTSARRSGVRACR